MPYLLAAVGGYLIGSFPTAYVLVKKTAGIDIRTAGSGNVGGYNTYSVTRSKFSSALVILLDVFKGYLTVALANALAGPDPIVLGTAFFAAILGHNYPVWLRFKGGRGLATAAGGLFGIGVSYTVVWCLTWFLTKKVTGDILKGNIVATIATPVTLWLAPSIVPPLMIAATTADAYIIQSIILSLVLLLSHIQPLRNWLRGEPLL